MSSSDLSAATPTAEQFRAAQDSEDFRSLRRTHRGFVWPMTVAFLVWYVLYVLLGAYFHEFMAIRLFGSVNLGLVLGLLQFVTTFAITGAYVAFANRRLDPQARRLRESLEAEAAAPREETL